MVLVDCVSRLIPGVLGSDESAAEESFSEDLLEYPQYTRPANFRGMGSARDIAQRAPRKDSGLAAGAGAAKDRDEPARLTERIDRKGRDHKKRRTTPGCKRRHAEQAIIATLLRVALL